METTAVSTSPAEAFNTPGWVQDAVFYQIFPDRFARSDTVPKPPHLEPWEGPPTIYGFKGGDLVGVTERLDYLSDLGINAIYFCPVFKSTANHRYHTYDYYEVDPLLGGNAALRKLIDEAHRRNIRVVLDGVFNHASRGFFQFNHILENGGLSPYIDWFNVYSWPLRPYGPGDQPAGYNAWWGDRALPEFNTNNPDVREFLWGVGQYWIEQGVDGWRLDVPNEIDDDEFWREFRRRVKLVNPEAYIVGEIWGDARRWLQGDQFDAVMNYLFTKACLGFFTGPAGIDYSAVDGTGLNPVSSLDVHGFCHAIETVLGLYPWNATMSQLNLLDSHDTARFLTIARGDETAYRLAVFFAMAFPGAPCIYYGDEVGMTGGQTVEDARRAFRWDPGTWNIGLRDYVKGCVSLRHTHASLRRGNFTTLYARDNVFAFARRLGEELAVVAVNASSQAEQVDIPLPAGLMAPNLTSVWGDSAPSVEGGVIRSWRIAPRSGAMLAGTGIGE